MAFLQGKTPISFLQELCTKRGCTPQYDLVANEGAVHEPTFAFKVTAGEFIGIGKGASKKKAKHNAALNVLQQMMGTGEAVDANVVNQLNEQMNEGDDKDTLGNPVGELQEMTQKRLWPPPTYEFTSEQGPPHAREFICTVRLHGLIETRAGKSKKVAKRIAAHAMVQLLRQGAGKSKKVAKRNAAHAMVQLLRQGVQTQVEQPLEDIDEPVEDEHMPLPNSEMRNAFSALREGKSVNPLNSQAQVKISQFFNQLRKEPGNGIVRLHNEKLSSMEDYKTMLADIGKEQKFEITYVDLPEPTFTGQQQCLVQLASFPVAVCHGVGSNRDLAKCNAALNALHYLRVITQTQRK